MRLSDRKGNKMDVRARVSGLRRREREKKINVKKEDRLNNKEVVDASRVEGTKNINVGFDVDELTGVKRERT